jgi:2-polyprenyl-3-methyl-5-hydroxy-6-metoxy-1,4-benzoquinol methylase
MKGTDLLFEAIPRTFALSRCRDCSTLFIDPGPHPQDVAAFYSSPYWWSSSSSPLKTLERVYRRLVLRDHISFIMKSVRALPLPIRSVRLLDVGCGGATLLSLLKARGLAVQGFDISRHAAQIADVEDGIEVCVGDRLSHAGFAESSFDVVTLFHVLEHVIDPRELLRDVRRLLKPEGRVILQVPNIDSWQFRIFGSRWYGLDIPRHLVDYSNRSAQRLLSGCGFRVIRTRHFNLRDNAPALASSLVRSLDPLSRRIRQQQKGIRESTAAALVRHALYFGLVVCAVPFAFTESAAGAGATIMIEAGNA